MNQQGSKPNREFRAGSVRAAIWTNPRQTSDGKSFNSHKVLLERIYRDPQGNFKSTGSLDLNDIPKAIMALEKVYEYLVLKGSEPTNSTQKAFVPAAAYAQP